MTGLIHTLLQLIATATDRQLARHIQYLKTENRILRDKLTERITVTPREKRRLLKFGKPLGAAIKQLITIVSPRTFARWIQGDRTVSPRRRTRKPGRPRTENDVRDLILRLARENLWGYTRILGELKKLGLSVSRSTVVNILKENGLDPGPKRGERTWDEFITRHAKTLWACDFFSARTWMMRGFVEIYCLFFIHVGSRRVHLAGVTTNPDRIWTTQQARNMAMVFGELPDRPRYLIRDLVCKFGREFDAILKSEGIDMVKVGPRKPNLNAFAERWIQSVKTECLDHFIVFGEAHLRHILKQYVDFYNEFRPHQSRDNRPLSDVSSPAPDIFAFPEVACEERLGGLLKHYFRKAA